jgi:hypothetical protein
MTARPAPSRRRRALRQLATLPLVWLCVARTTTHYSLWAAGTLLRQVVTGRRPRREEER